MLDYETLKLVWWLFVGVLLIGFAIMDGHDMGVGTLLPFVAKTDVERRIAINTVAPHWDGNQVWFITGGGAIFAAWPMVYATAFSGFYWAMLLVLCALFFRPVGFDYRSKVQDTRWRNTWDWLLFFGSFVPPLIFGVAFGNLLQGVPFHFDDTLRSTYTGSFFGLLNPFALLCGVVATSMISFHGANYLILRTDGDVQARSRKAALGFGTLAILAFAAGGLWVANGINGYVITAGALPGALPDPLAKTVIVGTGAWFHNFEEQPLLWLVPGLGFAGAIVGLIAAAAKKGGGAFVGSAISILGIIGTAGVSMFPFLMPSSSDPRSSLTVWDATSSHFTLGLMFVCTLIFLPLIVLYTSWAYKVMRGKVTAEYIDANTKSLY